MTHNGFKIWWDDTLEIARGEAHGEINEEVAQGILSATLEINEKYGQSVQWLIDLGQMTKANSRGRKLLSKAAGDPGTEKLAFVGGSVLVRTVINFIITAAGRDESRFFADEKDAINWLLGEEAQ